MQDILSALCMQRVHSAVYLQDVLCVCRRYTVFCVCRVYTVSCLAKQRVLLYSTVPGYTDLWTSVLNTADCKVLTKFPPGAAKSK